MKNVLGNLALSALSTGLSRLSIGNAPRSILNQRRNLNFGRTIVRTQTRRRVVRRKKRNGMEINKAEGGFKSLTIPYRTQAIGINCYGRLVVTKIGDDWVYGIQMENEGYATYVEYNLAKALVESQELRDRLKTSSQYKVSSVMISTFVNRIPEGRDRLSRILLFVNTPKVIVTNPKIQTNVMRISGYSNGTKNFNFRLTSANMGKENMEWFSGNTVYPGNFYLHIVGEDKNSLADDSETTVILGTVKFTFRVFTRIQDYVRNDRTTTRAFEKVGIDVKGTVVTQQGQKDEKKIEEDEKEEEREDEKESEK